MFCSAIGAIDDIRPSPGFEMSCADPLNRRLSHAYDVRALPIIA